MILYMTYEVPRTIDNDFKFSGYDYVLSWGFDIFLMLDTKFGADSKFVEKLWINDLRQVVRENWEEMKDTMMADSS